MGVRRCSVNSCLSASNKPEDTGVTYHKMPNKTLEVRRKWLDLCKIKEDPGKLLYVCSRHFLRADFVQSKTKYWLKQSIFPSIFPWNKDVLKKVFKQRRDSEKSDTISEADVEDKNTSLSDKSLNFTDTQSISPENSLRTKRIRKKKVIPDCFTDDDMKRRFPDRENDLIPGERIIDFETTVKADCIIESEDSTTDDIVSELDSNVDAETSMFEKQHDQGKTPKKAIKKPKSIVIDRIKDKKLEKKPSMIKDKIVVEDKLSPDEMKQLEVPSEKIKEISKPQQVQQPPTPEKPDVITPKPSNETKNIKPQEDSNSGPLTFELNARVEALDFNQTWSPATVIEIDYEGTEVLVRFDSGHNQYDEWIRTDSSSIRLPTSGNDNKTITDKTPVTQMNEVTYEVGEPCMAYWIDAKKFPGVVKEIIDHDTYVVQFDDGYVKALKSSKMMKSSRSSQNSPLFLPVKGTKEERRKRKRKLNVKSLFKKRIKTKSTSLDSSAFLDSTADESILNKSEVSGFSDTLWYPSFENGRPVGITSSLTTKAGIKETVIVPDPRLPEKWEKHLVPRENRKWYCVIIDPNGKKLRGPADIQRYINDHPNFNHQDFAFEFNVFPRHSRLSLSTPKSKPHIDNTPDITPTSQSKSESLKIAQVNGVFHCPKEGCDKKFRKENLVQMHVKHYHPEYKKLLGSTPNVLDLVYKRLHAEELDQTPNRSYEFSKRNSYTPTDDMYHSSVNDSFESQKDIEIKRLLNSNSFDTVSEGLSQNSTGSENKLLRDNLGDATDDLKSLVVTTKTGLKIIPPAKKEIRDEGICSDLKETKKRKFDDLYEDNSGNGMLGECDPIVTMPPQVALDHIIGEDGKVIKIEHMRKEEIINCTCGVTEEDGLMIQCELCLCWQHAHCNNIYRETEVPEKYVCYICTNPLRQRSSMKYKHDQDWLKHGKLPTGNYHWKDDERNRERFEKLRQTHDIGGGLVELKNYMHSIKLKLKIAELKNHPKLYLWSKPWDKSNLPEKQVTDNEDYNISVDGDNIMKEEKDEIKEENKNLEIANVPQPEAAIEAADCRQNLIEHIAHCQNLVLERLNDFESKLDELDNKTIDSKEDTNNLRLTTAMLLRDVSALKEFSDLDTF